MLPILMRSCAFIAKPSASSPTMQPPSNNWGVARRDKGDLEGALQDYGEAIRLKPDDAAAFYNRGNARRDKGELEAALQDYGEAICLKPDLADPTR